MTGRVVLVDDERHLRTACTQALELAGYAVEAFSSADGALDRLSPDWDGVLITDIKMPGTDGLALMRRALDIDAELPVILITGHGDVAMAVQAIKDGAYDFIEKPFASEILVDSTKRALEKRRLVLENRALRSALDNMGGIERAIIGRTPATERLREKILAYGPTDADVLIRGETGSGKEIVARNLHQFGPRRERRFVAINCGAMPETMAESELFGHERGAFTGAHSRRIGKFEHADGGTVFLDEIESMPLDLQIKLLRVLQERLIVRLGSNREIPVDVRVIAATKKDLRAAIAEGRFREDLYYRLDILSLDVPPLRDRRDDIPLLFHHFLAQAATRYRREPPEVTPEALGALLHYDWPGNVRELQSAALRHALGLAMEIGGTEAAPDATDASGGSNRLAERLASVERQMIARELAHHGGNLKATYESLGISRKTLYDKIRKHGLERLTPESG